jgi:hypothetical protein
MAHRSISSGKRMSATQTLVSRLVTSLHGKLPSASQCGFSGRQFCGWEIAVEPLADWWGCGRHPPAWRSYRTTCAKSSRTSGGQRREHRASRPGWPVRTGVRRPPGRRESETDQLSSAGIRCRHVWRNRLMPWCFGEDGAATVERRLRCGKPVGLNTQRRIPWTAGSSAFE